MGRESSWGDREIRSRSPLVPDPGRQALPALSLTLCGRVAAAVDGSPVPGAVLGSKSLALLAFLALEPGAHSRDEVTALLWGSTRRKRPAPRFGRRSRICETPSATRFTSTERRWDSVTSPESDVRHFLAAADTSPREAAEVDIAAFSERTSAQTLVRIRRLGR